MGRTRSQRDRDRLRVSGHYSLARAQAELDFVDVYINRDLPVFIDPRALRRLTTPWARECVSLIQNFFSCVINEIKAGRSQSARLLLQGLSEPNETRLGFSRGRPRGHGVGPGYAHDLVTALGRSAAVTSGLLVDLEESALFVDGIDIDVVSDMTTNIIRAPLVAYTAHCAEYYGIPMVRDVASGQLWDPTAKEWDTHYVDLPVAEGFPLLLVPKAIVRRRLEFQADEYYRHYILEELRTEEIDARTELVHLLRDGRHHVYKKALQEKYGYSKRLLTDVTVRKRVVLERYRQDKAANPRSPLSLDDLSEMEGASAYDWDAALRAVTALSPGRKDADAYVDAIQRLMEALFYPGLGLPEKEVQIHKGRKRIDITFSNLAEGSFFKWLAAHYPAATVVVECKNYSGDPENPELDQLSGRFSPSRGKVGFLVCRTLQDRGLFEARCADTAGDDRGYIIPLDDSDLATLVEFRKAGEGDGFERFLRKRFNKLIR